MNRTDAEERERCLLQWAPDFSPAGDPRANAAALWRTRPAHAAINVRANRELWADRGATDLIGLARTVQVPVAALFGADDPRPWTAADELIAALPKAHRVVLADAGHAPWAERPAETRDVIVNLVRSTRRVAAGGPATGECR